MAIYVSFDDHRKRSELIRERKKESAIDRTIERSNERGREKARVMRDRKKE